jgi:hypothetical protein
MNLKHRARDLDGLTQFAKPPCFELAGREFTFVMDGGVDFELRVTGRTTCEWNAVGDAPHTAEYYCVKADDHTYLLSFELLDEGRRASHSYVIDLEQRLVTRHVALAGLNPRHPYLLTNSYDFGAIRTEGHALPYKRHYFTDDLLGTTVEWHWTTDLVSRHAYIQTNFYRVTWEEGSAMEDSFEQEFYKVPAIDELATYVRIKEDLYLFVVTEEKVERLLGDDQPFRSDSMLFIENFDRGFHVGRAFGWMMTDSGAEPLWMVFGAFGNRLELSDAFLAQPNRYTA